MKKDLVSQMTQAIVMGKECPELKALRSGSTPDLGLKIYRRNYQSVLTAALADTYGVTCQIVGEEGFRYLARHFIAAHPSRHVDLNQYGEGFAAFLKERQEETEVSYLADVAALEWARHQSFYAADPEPGMRFAELRQCFASGMHNLQLTVAPSLRLVDVTFRADKIWEWHQGNCHIPLEIEACSLTLAVNRRRTGIEMIAVSDESVQLVRHLQDGLSVEELVSLFRDRMELFSACLFEVIREELVVAKF